MEPLFRMDLEALGHAGGVQIQPQEIMEFMQCGAQRHAEQLGVGREALLDAGNCVWMLVRSRYILRTPLLRAHKLTLETWPCGSDSVCHYRAFSFFMDGAVCGEAVQTWVLADIDKRRLLPTRKTPQVAALVNHERPLPYKPGKLHLPEMKEISRFTVPEADTDVNRHVNNAQYVRYAMEALGLDDVQSLQICYEKECFAGDTLILQYGQSQGLHYVCGQNCEGQTSFTLCAATGDQDHEKDF